MRPPPPPSRPPAAPGALPRREFLADSGRALTAALLAAELPWVSALAACARADARMEAPFTALTVAEVRTTRAFASRILPSGDGLPGAEEAGAVYFIDRALGGGFVKGMLPTFRKGLADLDRRARSRGAGDQGFAALPEAGQDAVLREVEKSEFFGGSRFLVVAAVFSDPSYGGNRDGAGWKVLDMAQQPMFQPPFGYYDAEEARTARGGNS